MAADLNLDWVCSLPRTWSYGVTKHGRVFFINEEAKSTTWLHPVTGEAVVTGHRASSDLPTGWEEGYTFEGARYYINDLPSIAGYGADAKNRTWFPSSDVCRSGRSATCFYPFSPTPSPFDFLAAFRRSLTCLDGMQHSRRAPLFTRSTLCSQSLQQSLPRSWHHHYAL
ncbi:pleckstrin homology domain-containing family A member 5 isoform X12 [Lissotriton helveticus]